MERLELQFGGLSTTPVTAPPPQATQEPGTQSSQDAAMVPEPGKPASAQTEGKRVRKGKPRPYNRPRKSSATTAPDALTPVRRPHFVVLRLALLSATTSYVDQ